MAKSGSADVVTGLRLELGLRLGLKLGLGLGIWLEYCKSSKLQLNYSVRWDDGSLLYTAHISD